MKRSFLTYWVQPFLVGLGLFGFAFGASAETYQVDDQTISSVSASSFSSTAQGATGVSFTLTFELDTALSDGMGLNIWNNALSCSFSDWTECPINLASTSVAGMPGRLDIDDGNPGSVSFFPTGGLAVGTYTLTFSNVTMPDYSGAVRFFISSQGNEQEVPDGKWVGTNDANAVTFGTILASGTVTDPSGSPLSTWGEVRNENYSLQQGFNTDEYGFYAVGNPGFASGDTVTITVYPDATLGLFTTTDTFTYSGSRVTKNLEAEQATKTVSGVVTYADGTAATTVRVNANGQGVWAGDDVDATGAYSFTTVGGTYDLCLGDIWDNTTNKPVEKDWYTKNNENCKALSFTDDDSTETKEVNFKVQKADARVKGTFKNPDGSAPSNGGWVSFWKDDLWFGGNVSNEDGSFNIAVLGGNTEKTTTLRVTATGSMDYQASYNSNDASEHTYWATNSVTVEQGKTTDLGEQVLKEKDVTFTATVVDEAGSPVPDIHVNAWQEGGGWTDSITDENGVAMLYLFGGDWNIQPSLWNQSTYLYAEQPLRRTFVSGDSDSGTFTLTATTLIVSVTTLGTQGESVNVQGWANCWSQGGANFGGEVRNGTGSFGAIAGEYRCNLWVNDQNYQASGEQSVEFEDGVDASLEFSLQQRTATITVYVKTADDNQLVKDASNARVNAHSTDSGWTDQRLQDGKAELRVAPGTYRIGMWFEGQSDYIFGWANEKEVTVKDGDSVQRTLSVNRVSGRLSATLKDTDGNAVKNAWVGCGNWPELKDNPRGDFDSGRVIENGAQSGADGIAVVGLVEGHEYECWVGVNPDVSSLIGPASQQFDFRTTSEQSATFVFQESDAKIQGKVTFAKDAGVDDGDIENVWCNGWAEEGYNAWDDSFKGEYNLNVTEGKWHVHCGTEVLNDDGERTWYDSQGDIVVNVGADDDVVTKNLVLSESLFGAIPRAVTETFDSTQPKQIVLEDGTSLDIPAYAIANSGNVTLTAEVETHAVDTALDSPFGWPWDFEAVDATGVPISGNFNSAVTLTIPYTKSILKELDISEDALAPKMWDEETATWSDVDSVSQDKTDNSISFTLQHFTQVGLTYNNRIAKSTTSEKKSSKKVGVPRRVKVSNITVSAATATWLKPKSGKVKKYTVQVRPSGLSDKSAWVTVKNVRKLKLRGKGLSAGTRYQVHVRACNASGCGNFTKWVSFKTKE